MAAPGDIDAYDLLTLHPLEIGRQITLLHYCMYRAIKPIELVDAAWTKQEKYIRSPQLLKASLHITSRQLSSNSATAAAELIASNL